MRPSLVAQPIALVVVAAALAGAALSSRAADWQDPAALLLLLGLAIVADRQEMRSASGSGIVGSMPAFVLAATLFGPAPAVAIGLATTLLQRKAPALVLGDLAAFSSFPLAAGLFARTVQDHTAGAPDSMGFMLVVVAAFLLAWTVNFAVVAGYMRLLTGRSLELEFAATWKPLVSSQMALALGTGTVALLFAETGTAAIALAAVLVVTYNRLQRELLEAKEHADAEQRLTSQLREQNAGLVQMILDFVDARDHMTARHSAAVARYATRIAEACGCSEHEQQLVHTAGLYHDVGKVMFTDSMFGPGRLSDEEWEIVKRHPERGADLLRHLPRHEEVAEIILAHHERVDGTGYPRGLCGDEIPLLARMISIADTYDVMTGRDTYRQPVSSEEAVAELRRVAGTQLDARLVDVFVEKVLAGESIAFRHGDDADFEAEVARERQALQAPAQPALAGV